MKQTIGGILTALGVIAVLIDFLKDTSVTTTGTYIGGQLIGGGSVNNIGLLQQQMMLLQTGLAMFLGSIVLLATAGYSGSAPGHEQADPTPLLQQTTSGTVTSAERQHWIEDDRERQNALNAEADQRMIRIAGITVLVIMVVLVIFGVVSMSMGK